MTVMVTGGSRGIGLAIAQELAKAGHQLLLVARNARRLERAAHAIRETSAAEVQYLTCDLASLDDIEKLHTACVAAGFRPNVLVLNAGLFIEGSLMESSDAAFADSLNVNLVSMYRVVKSFVRSLKAMKGSRIILIGSTGGFEAYPGGALCGVAKWGVRGFAVNLRHELMGAGVGVTLVAPGGTLTDAWAGEEIPEGRLLEPADIGKLVAATLTLSSQAVVEEIIVRPMLGDIRE